MKSRSFAVVTDILQDTIDRSAKSQSDADGELAWLRKRLENKHREPQSRAKEVQEAGDRAFHKPRELFKQPGYMIDAMDGKENTSLKLSAGPRACEVPSSMSVLQLRRFLKAIGQPTVGHKSVLINRLNMAVSSGVVKSFVESSKGWKADESILCAGERRKREAMLALAKAVLGSNKTISDVAAPRQPLMESSSSSASGNPGPTLSGQEQDAVLAKIRSAAKRSASPEKKLPFQDDDTPTTKSLRLKKEVEDRLERQNQLLCAKKQPDPSSKPVSPSPCTPPLVRTPGQQSATTTNPTNQASAGVSTAPSARPTVPTNPAPMPSSPSPCTPPLVRTPGQQPATTSPTNQTSPGISTPPSARPPLPTNPAPMPPTSPKRPAFTPPPPTIEAPRPAATLPTPGRSFPCATDMAKETPAKPDKPSQGEDTAGGDDVELSAASRSFPAGNVSITSAAVEVTVKTVPKAVAPRSGVDKSDDSKTGVNKSTDPKTALCSPARFQTPNANTPARKANAFAKDSISTTGPSGLKVAAHKALHRVVAKPSAPSTPAKVISTPAGNSTTKDAFAKFRAMDSAKKSAAPSSFKSRQTPGSKVKPGNNPTMPPPQNHKADYNNFGFSKAAASSQAKRGVQGAQAAASSFRATQHALVEASATPSRDKAALAAEKERERVRSKAAADKMAADEARREAQAAAEAKAREAAFKAAAERKAKQKAAEAAKRKEMELKKRKEEEIRREEEKQAAIAEALRQAELKRKAEEKKAAEEQAALAQKRAQQQKPPTPPRPASKAPPTPPRPSQQTGAPPTPPRPNSVQVAASSKTLAKSPFSSTPNSGESFQLALAKKREEIKERMDVLRQTGYASEVHASQAQKHYAAPAPKAAPVVKAPIALTPTPAPSPAPVKSVPKEDRESYDDYEVEGAESESECGDNGEEQAQEIPEPQEPTDKSGIPDWARGQTLAALLDRQYGGPNPINPDTIFPEFFTCNLEHIFNTKKSKWDRTSSGNWHKDRLTVAEKLAYQRAMGFNN